MPGLPARSIPIILGGYDIGILAELVCQGILFAQITKYWGNYRADMAGVKLFVFGLFLATTLKSRLLSTMYWAQNVEHFSDLSAASNLYFTHWLFQSNLTVVALIALYVQAFFAHRLWRISKNTYLTVSVGVILSSSFVFACVSCWFTFASLDKAVNNHWIQVHRATMVAGDGILCGSIAYILLMRSKDLPQMAGTLNRITSLTFQSMAPPTVCALVNLVCSLVDNDTITVWMALVVGTNMVLPKLYAISAMWTLNSREDFRTLLSRDIHSNIDISEGNFPKTTNSDLGELSQIRAPSPRRTGSGEQMELHSLDKVFPHKAPLPDNNTV
ncbi:hypothetical protein C8J57DRAFT_1221353 [Mycena rebaudengoi]|nr:hypothetical protein C8J57DRAFT_1221353 [Mycena rebaudengoi]